MLWNPCLTVRPPEDLAYLQSTLASNWLRAARVGVFAPWHFCPALCKDRVASAAEEEDLRRRAADAGSWESA